MHSVNFYFLLSLSVSTCKYISCSQETGGENTSTFFVNAISKKNQNEEGQSELQKEFLGVFDKAVKYSNCSNDKNRKPDKRFNFTTITQEIFFFDGNPNFREAIMEFKNVLLGSSNLRDLLEIARKYRDEINISLWLKGFIASMLNQKDGISPFVPLVELKPDIMVSSRVLQKAKEESRKPPSERTCVVAIDEETGIENGIENNMWYFREDLMVNSHHWYWHLEYPLSLKENPDRSGELFYYVHQSILSRYHAERLSNGHSPVVSLDIKPNGIILEPYYSFLEDTNSGLNWADRPPNSRLRDVKTAVFGTPFDIKIAEVVKEGKNLLEAATTGIMEMSNGSVPLNLRNYKGIDYLAKTAEATTYHSVNPKYYGDWHNQGHLLISFINDPQNPNQIKEVGVVFYRWHKTIDNLFVKHKDTLSPYAPRGGEFQLIWPGITIENLQVVSVGRKSVPPLNTLYTFWNERRFDLAKGLDFSRNANINGSVDICVKHLNHDEFDYTFTVTKSSALTGTSKATVRIFLAPRLNEKNKAYSMEEQRKLFFVLDTFTVYLRTGRNVIQHSSKASSLTLEFAKSLHELENDDYNDNPNCGCGWPHHMLIPKGKPSGMVFDLFVMVTNGEEDTVIEDSPATGTCSQGYLYCGRIKEKYPDSKPMGYPFDRKVYTVPDFDSRRPVANLEEYVKNIPNMKTIQVTIVHEPNRKERSQS